MRPLIFISLLILLSRCIPIAADNVHEDEIIQVKFTYQDDRAQKVCIAGSFNQWSPRSHCMTKKNKIWTLTLSLPPGRYPYLFLIDDRISKLDPGTPLTEENGFGTRNSVLVVE